MPIGQDCHEMWSKKRRRMLRQEQARKLSSVALQNRPQEGVVNQHDICLKPLSNSTSLTDETRRQTEESLNPLIRSDALSASCSMLHKSSEHIVRKTSMHAVGNGIHTQLPSTINISSLSGPSTSLRQQTTESDLTSSERQQIENSPSKEDPNMEDTSDNDTDASIVALLATLKQANNDQLKNSIVQTLRQNPQIIEGLRAQFDSDDPELAELASLVNALISWAQADGLDPSSNSNDASIQTTRFENGVISGSMSTQTGCGKPGSKLGNRPNYRDV
ncbi:unnamed protein product [Protopolystoma xenopodis]|uniref:Uncharacterized protein n=1 Tax=Protopolystoma xenopodis TaxID=117903 RepID=A0A3S5BKK0_9PLAT|nr:unnamed protein product [Protopolystoma xenopodis]